MSLNDKRTSDDDEIMVDAEQWMSRCPLSPSIKRQKVGGYSSGGSWHEGRVELKFDQEALEIESRQMVQEVILQAFERLNQTIIGEGLCHRPYTQHVMDKGQHTSVNSPRRTLEYLGEDGDASCGRIGSIIPISLGYTVYGRVDNIQVLVQDPAMFANMVDQLVDRKVSMLRQATVSLGALELNRTNKLEGLEVEHQGKLKKFGEIHRDKLVAWICEFPAIAENKLAAWESQRQEKTARLENEYQQAIMDIEHEYHQKKGEFLQVV